MGMEALSRSRAGGADEALSRSFVSLAAIAFRRLRRGDPPVAGTGAPGTTQCPAEDEQTCASTT